MILCALKMCRARLFDSQRRRVLVKRFFDMTFTILLLLVLFPIVVLVAGLVRYNLGRGVIFRQVRPGRHGRKFEMLKFRSMRDAVNAEGLLLPDSARLTTFGEKLRATSLDELPGLWNVLRGDMSLVGPRPLLVEYLSLYSNDQARRHEIQPGITGWAQVNGRNAISWDEKFKLDVWYVDNQSLWLDIKILLLTAKKVFVKEGISADGHVTIEPFRGNKP